MDLPLIVLITNNTASAFAGTERYVEQVCVFLVENGHFPIVYSTQVGEFAAILRRHGVLVVNDLRELTKTPDIIHGHHHLDSACALARFPGVPCVYFVHGVTPWEEHCFPDMPRIYRYVSVSSARLTKACTEGIPPEKIVTIPNFVDRRRFGHWHVRSGQIPHPGPLRALIFGNYPQVAEREIRRISGEMGLDLHCAGGHYGDPVKEPEQLFPTHDIVFAYGKSAMEALCCGCEVILSSHLGIGELITSDNFLRLRDRNFGISVCRAHPGDANVRGPMATAVKRRLEGLLPVDERCISSLFSDEILPRLVRLYREAIAYWDHHRTHHEITQEFQVFSRYLRFLQVTRFEALQAQLAEGTRRQQELDWELEQARTERALAQQKLKTHPLRFLLGDRLKRWEFPHRA